MATFGRLLRMTLVLLLAMGSVSVLRAEPSSSSRVIGGVRGPTGIMRPLLAHEIKTGMVDFQQSVDQLAAQTEQVKLDPNAPKDEIEKQFNGAISLARHQADINALRDQFTMCMASMQQEAKAAAEQGKQSAAEKEALAACEAHCGKVLDKLNALHHNTAMLASATRQQYFLNAWDEHQKLMAELKVLAKDCPMQMDRAMPSTHNMPEGSTAMPKDPKDPPAKDGNSAHH